MRGSVIGQLILKDWRLQRMLIILSVAGGGIALAVFQRGGEIAMVLGSVWFFIALILVGTLLPTLGIVNERKKQNLAFVMSLPISAIQYTTAKLLSTVGMFLVPWVTLMVGAMLLIETRGIVPHGAIPIMLILAALPFVALSLITSTALVSESEGWAIAATIVCNSSYGLVWYFISRIPALIVNAKGLVPVWNFTALSILVGEFGLIALILGLTFYLQFRKRDFV